MDREAERAEVRRLVLAARRGPGATFPGGADDSELASLARRLRVPLPEDLAEWLRLCKGDLIGPGGLFGARPDLSFVDMPAVLDSFPQWRDLGWLPVAGDGCGDYYVLVRDGGYVGFVDQTEYGAIDYVVASNIWTFVRMLLLEEEAGSPWPFDREFVLEQDPGMASLPTQLLPWNADAR